MWIVFFKPEFFPALVTTANVLHLLLPRFCAYIHFKLGSFCWWGRNNIWLRAQGRLSWYYLILMEHLERWIIDTSLNYGISEVSMDGSLGALRVLGSLRTYSTYNKPRL